MRRRGGGRRVLSIERGMWVGIFELFSAEWRNMVVIK
jgi:hypothetical protein